MPPAARSLHAAVTGAVLAAGERDAAALDLSCARMGRLDPEQTHMLLAHVVRALVEQGHPTGVSSEDLGRLVGRVMESTAAWWPTLQTPALLAVLTGAFGIHPETDEDDEGTETATPATAGEVLAAAAIVTADLLGQSGRSLPAYLSDAFAELARDQTVEMP